MKLKDIERAFTEISLDEMGPLLESLTEIHSSRKEARLKELEDEMARLRGELVGSRRNGRRADRVVKAQRATIASDKAKAKGNKAAKADAAPKRGSPKPKYRDPDTGVTWAGRGGTPKWIRSYEAEGRGREEFLIDSPG